MPSTMATMDAICPFDAKPQFVHTRLGSIECAVWGQGPAVLSLHGAMGGYDQSILLARTVCEQRFRFVALSRPGYLGTPLSRGALPQQQGDLCAEVLTELGIERAAVLAISGGGPAALQFALRHGNRCRGLAMISACSGRLEAQVPIQWQIMKALARIPGIASSLRRKIARDPERAAVRSIRDTDLRRQTVHDSEAGPLMLALQLSTMDRMDRRIAGTDNDIRQSHGEMNYPLEKIAVPTLVVHGTIDNIVPFAQAKALALRIPGAELLALEGGEHVAIFTHLQDARKRVTQFIDSLPD